MTATAGGGPAAAPAGAVRLPARLQLAFLAGPMLSMIDSSVVNVAVPVIVHGLHTTLGTAAWAVSGYLLGLACGLAVTPWLARRLGTLPAYSAAMIAFTLASAVCALVPTVGLLIAARVVQGLVGAPMVPLRYRHGDRELSLFCMTAVIGTPMDVTIEELAIESFYPADQATTEALWARREDPRGSAAGGPLD